MDEDYGKKIYNLLVGALVVAGVIGVIWYINTQTDDDAEAGTMACRERLDFAVSLYRDGDPYDELDLALDNLGDECAWEYDVYVDYMGMASMYRTGFAGACKKERANGIKGLAVRYAREDGFCY